MAKRNVSFVKPSEPSFIRKLKERAGYKEGPTVETKKVTLSKEDLHDENDEKPVVVVLQPGDLTQEEADALASPNEDVTVPTGKLMFRKPEKRSSDITTTTSTKKAKSVHLNESQRKAVGSGISNKSLLSFDDDEDAE